MAAGSIEELLDLLYTEIEEAKNAPLSNDRCVVDRDRVLDMIDDVKAEMPVEIKRAKDIVAQRNDYMADAKQKADRLRQEAEDYAKELLNKDWFMTLLDLEDYIRTRILRGDPAPHGGGRGRRL